MTPLQFLGFAALFVLLSIIMLIGYYKQQDKVMKQYKEYEKKYAIIQFHIDRDSKTMENFSSIERMLACLRKLPYKNKEKTKVLTDHFSITWEIKNDIGNLPFMPDYGLTGRNTITSTNHNKTIFNVIIVLIVTTAFLLNCQKVERSDFVCTIYKVIQIDGVTTDSISYVNLYIDMTDNEMIQTMKNETYTGWREYNGIQYTINNYMRCGESICK